MLVGMPFAGLIKFFKTFVIQFKNFLFAAKFRKFSPARTMFSIVPVIKTAAVVKNGKETDHSNVGTRFRRQEKTIVLHLVPMFNAMNIGLVRPIFKNIFH